LEYETSYPYTSGINGKASTCKFNPQIGIAKTKGYYAVTGNT